MESITIALILLLAVVISATIARLLPIPVPPPLIQIALGATIAAFTENHITLQPEVFFLFFLPPLLFLDGWQIPKEGLFRDKWTILELVLGLVLFTVVGVGFFINWLIPSMPLAVAFALAAIISPTDPIAISAISARVPVPKRLMHILEGESLLNDASGLVCMRFAVVAMLTGSFSLPYAIATFLWLVIGGVFIGVVITFTVTRINDYASRRLGEETGSQILISVLIPFAAYILAEHFHCSGILAAVSAGVTMSYAEQRGHSMAVTRVRRVAVWDTIRFTLNGVIFVLLGEQLPNIVSGAAEVVRETGHHEPIWLIVYVVAINAALAGLRLAWVWVSLRFTLFRAAKRGLTVATPDWRLVVTTSVAGVRGAITLAGILTLPLFMEDGTLFPARDLAVFLAAGVIITSLVIASLSLPFLLQKLELPPESKHQKEEDTARLEAAEEAIKAVQRMLHDIGPDSQDAGIYVDVGTRVMEAYRRRLEGYRLMGDEVEKVETMETVGRRMMLAAIGAERDTIFRLARARQISDDVSRKLVHEIDLFEARWRT
ncbi:Na+/H+ antiporter [Agrobacterium sp. NPDC089420]|uniref:Na+/H+ antiporter n=1 Tax=Agrobacterium sp. NPDC089420 TaxID=3363918 RepID=UPI0038514C6C